MVDESTERMNYFRCILKINREVHQTQTSLLQRKIIQEEKKVLGNKYKKDFFLFYRLYISADKHVTGGEAGWVDRVSFL